MMDFSHYEGSPAASAFVSELRSASERAFSLEFDLAMLEKGIHEANVAGDFESGVELTAAYLDREQELEIAKQIVWALLRKEFIG